MFKQFLVVSILLVGLSLADQQTGSLPEVPKPESPLNKLHSSLFYVSADPQEVDQTLEQLKSAKNLVETEGDPEGLFVDTPYNPELLIGLYSTEETCNPELAHEISQIADFHRSKHGVTNVIELLNLARRYQLASCQVSEIQSKLGKTVGNLDPTIQLELPSVEKFVTSLDSDEQDKILANDSLPTGEVADLVLAYMKHSGKAPRFVARVINNNHIKSTISSTVALLENINLAYQSGFGLLSELAKDSFAWRKLNVGEKNKILVGRFCQLAANAEGLREQVDAKL